MKLKTILFLAALYNLNAIAAEQPSEKEQRKILVQQQTQMNEIKKAIQRGDTEKIASIINAGFDVNNPPIQGKKKASSSLLHYALQVLLDSSIIKQTVINKKMLEEAEQEYRGHELSSGQIVEEAKSAAKSGGKSITSQDIQEQTRINVANLIKIMRLFISKGINIDALNFQNKTVLDVANDYKIDSVIAFLKSHGAHTSKQLKSQPKEILAAASSNKKLPQAAVSNSQEINVQKSLSSSQTQRKFEFANQSDNFVTVWTPNSPNSWQPKKLFPYEDSGILNPINGDKIYIYTKAGNFVIEIFGDGRFNLIQEVPMFEQGLADQIFTLQIRDFAYPASQQDILFIIDNQGKVDFVSRNPLMRKKI